MDCAAVGSNVRGSATHSQNAPALGRAELVLAIGMMAVFLFLVFRNAGLHPSVFVDEWGYSMGSRLIPLRAADTPLYVYQYVYHLTRYAGGAFLEYARVLNALFFVAAALLIYRVTRMVAGRAIAVYVALLSLIAPINIYTAYFMPEAMYFFVFWLLTWFALCRRSLPRRNYGTGVGALLGMLILVKVNAVFLLPGLAAFLLYDGVRARSRGGFRTALANLGYMVVATAVVRLGLGYLFARSAGLNVLGNRYGGLATVSLAAPRLSQMTGEIFGVLRGHAMGLALLFGVPLASLSVLAFRRGEEDDAQSSAIATYSLALLLPLLVAVAYFTASVIGEGPYESLARLHVRYYSFLFPLFLIVAAGQWSSAKHRRNIAAAAVSALLLAALAIYALISLTRLYKPSLVDCPELHGVAASTAMFYLAGVLGILALAVWVLDRRWGARVFLLTAVPVAVLCSAKFGTAELRERANADVYDRAGMFAAEELDQGERAKLAIVGSELASSYRALFYVDNPRATVTFLPSGAPFDRSAIPDDRTWVLLIGNHAVPAGVKGQISQDGFVLFKLPERPGGKSTAEAESSIDFAHPFRFGLVKRIEGLSFPQAGGRWSDGREVRIEMFSPLPKAFDLRLSAHAFGPNTQLPFLIHIGDQTKSFRLSSAEGAVTLPFATDGRQTVITIEVPQPTSPRQLGQGSDSRALGIALNSMSLVGGEKMGTPE